MRLLAAFLSVYLLLITTLATAQESPLLLANRWIKNSDNSYSREKIIRVGVRNDAHPFAYSSALHGEEDVLRGFGGYMIEICRRVLFDLTKSGPFKDYAVVSEVVDASKRFEQLHAGDIDLLCGPNSITVDRLNRNNASYPLFLSGVSYASVDTDRFPRTKYCKSIVGLLAGTTAITQGLPQIAFLNELARFDEPLEKYLALRSRIGVDPPDEKMQNNGVSGKDQVRIFRESIRQKIVRTRESTTYNSVDAEDGVDADVKPANVITSECPDGFSQSPVIKFDNHEQGIDAFCAGKILYYVGDIDIIRRKLGSRKGCEFVLRQETLTKEAYGIYFRRPSHQNGQMADMDGALFAEFSNILLRKMQSTDNILDIEFKKEFTNRKPSADLQEFFSSFKYANQF